MKPRSSLATILITGGMWLIVIVGCTSGTRTGQLSNSSKDPRIEFKRGSKITVHHNKEQNTTFFTQDDIKISPDIINGSQKVSGKHAFEIGGCSSLAHKAQELQKGPSASWFSMMYVIKKRGGPPFVGTGSLPRHYRAVSGLH